MSRPEDIPEDVWEAAYEPASVVFDASVDLYEVGTSGADPQLVIARAILAERRRAKAEERERCAGKAEALAAARRQAEALRGYSPETATLSANLYWCEEIAAAIREDDNG